MVNWESKIIDLITETSKWNKDTDESRSLFLSISLLKKLTGANISFNIELQDVHTAKIKDASPDFFNELVMNPDPIKALLSKHNYDTIYFDEREMQTSIFQEFFLALSSAVAIPINNTVIILGWSDIQVYSHDFKSFIEMARIRIEEILWQSKLQKNFKSVSGKLTAILQTLPHAVIFIENNGFSGWVNKKAASLLKLAIWGEQQSAMLSGAMADLRKKLVFKEKIEQEAMALFISPDAFLKDWIWELEMPGKLVLKVACLPINDENIAGKLWLFEDVTDSQI